MACAVRVPHPFQLKKNFTDTSTAGPDGRKELMIGAYFTAPQNFVVEISGIMQWGVRRKGEAERS